MLDNKDLRHLQKCELIIAEEIKRVCEKNSIRYFMVAGTVLGSVRHKGFIPWDDDMDFGMERNEYIRFCEVCKKDLKDEFYLQTWDTDPNYPFSFGKIRLKGTRIEELFATSKQVMENGIFVDVFPFDNVPDDSSEAKKQEMRYFIYKRALWIKKGYGKNILTQSIQQKIKYMMTSGALMFIPYSIIKNAFKRSLVRYNSQNTKRLVFDAPYKYEKNCVNRSWITKLIDGEFEGTLYPMPMEYDEYLTHLYSNYMQLPAPENRHSHDILGVDFGKY